MKDLVSDEFLSKKYPMRGSFEAVVSNVREGWKPLAIYLAHICRSINEKGVIRTLAEIVCLIFPTLKIFYYNFLIQKENRNRAYSFIKPNEQQILLKQAGFSNISENQFVYAGQAILNVATKSTDCP